VNITLIQVGRTDAEFVREGVELYFKRINRYTKFDIVTIPEPKNAGKWTPDQLKIEEGKQILARFTAGDYVVLLDEAGRRGSSADLAGWLQGRMNAGVRRLCFVIGGAYGFSKEVYARAADRVSLSAMTFSHQLVRVIFAEQLYRAFTILNNEPYHHN
jgi:23S rRNA (pseudouridine1915-N3)-methyltransferase